MPAAREIISEYARYYTFAFNMDAARPSFKRALDGIVVSCGNSVVPRGLNAAATTTQNQDSYSSCYKTMYLRALFKHFAEHEYAKLCIPQASKHSATPS